jgi:hypothetical protein
VIEIVLKTLLTSVIIVLFLIFCLNNISNSMSISLINIKHASIINNLRNNSYTIVNDGFKINNNISCNNYCLTVSMPKLINGFVGRVSLNA